MKVRLDTSMGEIELELDSPKAPKTAANFISYVKSGHYNGTIFHRVIDGFMIQGGGMDASMKEKPTGAPIENEADNGLKNDAYAVAMARTNDANSATSQFFVNLRDNHRLDFGISGAGYAVFGQVVEGMDVVDRIAMVPTTSRGPHENVPQVGVVIRRARELPPAEAPAAQAAPEPAKPE